MKRMLAVACLATVSQSAVAADISNGRFEEAFGTVGEAKLWGQAVIPTNGIVAGDRCGEDPDNEDYCDAGYGAGAYLGFMGPAHGGWSFIADLTIEYHSDTDAYEDESDGLYAGLGAHLITDAGSHQWGVFAVGITGTNHSDDSPLGVLLGGGLEARKDNRFIQGGALFSPMDPSDVDTIDYLLFLRAGGEHQLAYGRFEASSALGVGDWQDGSDYARGLWGQLSLDYVAPLHGDYEWFVGYQGDFSVTWEDVDEQVMLHALKVGIAKPINGGALPFETPNFRAPVTNAGNLN